MKKSKRPAPKKSPAKKRPPPKAKAAPAKKAPAVKRSPASAPILAWENDPDSGLKPQKRPSPTLSLGPLPLHIEGTPPKPALYPAGTPNFRYWTAADALRRAKDFWKHHLPDGSEWHAGVTLAVHLDAGEDLNAYYDRKSLSFFHGAANGKTIYTCESADIISHEFGHAVLDLLRPDLWDAALDEVAAFHESFSDLSTILTALQLVLGAPGSAERNRRPSRSELDLVPHGRPVGQGRSTTMNPQAAPADCLRNAVNSFFYRDPMQLPPDAPHHELSSEPHSFSRLFTSAMFEAMAGMLKLITDKPREEDLEKLSHDAGALLSRAVQNAALSAAFFSELAAQVIWADGSLFNGKYEDALRSAFVRRGLLSLEAARSLRAEAARAVVTKPTPGDEMPRGRDMMMRASAFGLTEGALVVRTASFSRRGLIAPAAPDTGSTPVPGVEQATQSFLETLFRRGRVDFSQLKAGISAVSHPTVRRKTHYLVEQNGQFHLKRRCFDEGWED